MSTVIIISKRPLRLGPGGSEPIIKVGRNEVDSSLLKLDAWHMKPLIDSGDIIIEYPPETPTIENGKLIEVEIPLKTVQVKPEVKAPAPVKKLSQKAVSTIKPISKFKRPAGV